MYEMFSREKQLKRFCLSFSLISYQLLSIEVIEYNETLSLHDFGNDF